jgi:neurotransmitter:Na+ symporter, NSS family
MEREKFSSRLGFILISAGCAIGLGNVWRFPYIAGKYGGAAFVLIYLFFLLVFGLPLMVMEFAVGRGSQMSMAQAFDTLEPKGSKWHLYKFGAISGNYLLMMFYTTIAGWMVLYFIKMARGQFTGLNSTQVEQVFTGILAQPILMTSSMIFVVAICLFICSRGLKNGVEKITKVMMVSLLVLMVILAINSLTLSGGQEGLKFYLYPDFKKLIDAGLSEAIFAAMGQAFFSLSIGIGTMTVFGSYLDKSRSITGEAINIGLLDTIVALCAGLIIFPACFAFGIQPDSGPSLIFLTLPNVFNAMNGGRIWGTMFFLFMSFAALSTVIAVFENIISFWIDLKNCSRNKAIIYNLFSITLLSIPCILGYNLWSSIKPFGGNSTILDLEDFIVSNNLLPLGSLVFLLFCVSRWGWGWDNFFKEANTGKGIKYPKWLRGYVTYILPIIILIIFIQGYLSKF